MFSRDSLDDTAGVLATSIIRSGIRTVLSAVAVVFASLLLPPTELPSGSASKCRYNWLVPRTRIACRLPVMKEKGVIFHNILNRLRTVAVRTLHAIGNTRSRVITLLTDSPGSGIVTNLARRRSRVSGAERIPAEFLKLGMRVSKRTIQRSMRQARPSRPHDQTWGTFLQNHANDSWACDVRHVTDSFFQPLFAFFTTELGSRRIVHVSVTRAPTDIWVAQQLREATPCGEGAEVRTSRRCREVRWTLRRHCGRKRHCGASNADQRTTCERQR